MTIAHLLEDFGGRASGEEQGTRLGDEALEDLRLAAFEQGHSAGWEDAMKAQAEDRARLSEVLSRNLEDLSFTYHEAMAHLVLAVEPVFRAFIDAALPTVLAEGFGAQIAARLAELAKECADRPVRVAVPVGSGEAVADLLGETLPLPVEVEEDDTLDAGMADLRVGGREAAIDLSHLVTQMREATEAYFHQVRKESEHG